MRSSWNPPQAGCWASNLPVSRFAAGFPLLSRSALRSPRRPPAGCQRNEAGFNRTRYGERRSRGRPCAPTRLPRNPRGDFQVVLLIVGASLVVVRPIEAFRKLALARQFEQVICRLEERQKAQPALQVGPAFLVHGRVAMRLDQSDGFRHVTRGQRMCDRFVNKTVAGAPQALSPSGRSHRSLPACEAGSWRCRNWHARGYRRRRLVNL